MTVFIAVLLTVLTFAFVVYPFFRQRLRSTGAGDDAQLQELHFKRDTSYSMLKELEFDFQSGILTEDDYRDLEANYKSKAISILKSLDDVGKGPHLEDEIERQVLKLRRGQERFCPQCGEKYQEGSRFCSYCGTSLEQGGRAD